MAVRHLAVHLRSLASGALFVAALLVPAASQGAAVVRAVRALPSASATRIIVEIEGAFRYHAFAGPDAKSVLVDIEGATIGEDVARIVPVSDRRVDGVLLLRGSASQAVRVSVDVSGKVAPRLEAGVDGSRLVLTFVDAVGSPAGPAIAGARGGTAGAGTGGSGQPASVAKSAQARDTQSSASREKVRARVLAMARAAESRREAAAARPPASVPRSVVQKPVVVLDPGHGGKDPGARAWTGEYEKDIVLDLAERVARRLRKSGDIEVVLTRSGDEYVELADRRDASRRWEADAFVSIHANASRSAAARGFETYYHSRSAEVAGKNASSDRVARRLARVENGGRQAHAQSVSRRGIEPASASKSSLPVLDRRAESARLARLVQTQLVHQLGMRYEAVRDLGAKEGPFFVIGDNAAPSVLVEAAFLTHREEGLRMRSEVYREQIAEGVARGIREFLEHQRRAGAL